MPGAGPGAPDPVLYLTIDDVLGLYGLIIGATPAQAGDHLRNRDGLESALARPRTYALYENADLALQATVLAHGIAEGQPFIDGNKRTAARRDAHLPRSQRRRRTSPRPGSRRLDHQPERRHDTRSIGPTHPRGRRAARVSLFGTVNLGRETSRPPATILLTALKRIRWSERFTVAVSLFEPGPGLSVVQLEQLEARVGENGRLDECRWCVRLVETGTDEADVGDVEVYIVYSQYSTGEYEDVPSWIAWSLESTHPLDHHREGSWIQQLQAEPQPIKLHRGLNRG